MRDRKPHREAGSRRRLQASPDFVAIMRALRPLLPKGVERLEYPHLGLGLDSSSGRYCSVLRLISKHTAKAQLQSDSESPI